MVCAKPFCGNRKIKRHFRAAVRKRCRCAVCMIHQSDSLCMTSPERSLGSNHVVLGGMMLPVSAMFISWSMVTGYKAKATAISPESTRLFNSPRPRIPPTKSIRLSRRRSVMPRMSRRIKGQVEQNQKALFSGNPGS